ncbi:MAG: DUF4337 domain-containing protein [Rhodocyclales bacterium]|nr:DUF4337 domain-containing protein [Rhodocyclales bacterium]
MNDLPEVVPASSEPGKPADDRLNSTVAASVAILATVLALFNIKDGNIVQAMAQEQAKSIDSWSYFQAKSTKQSLAESMLDQFVMERERSDLTAARAKLLDERILAYREKVKRYEAEKAEIRTQAEDHEKKYEQLNGRDDQFDIADAAISVAIALLGVSALTRKSWLVVFAFAFAGMGVASGLAGFFEWSFHLDGLAKFLS